MKASDYAIAIVMALVGAILMLLARDSSLPGMLLGLLLFSIAAVFLLFRPRTTYAVDEGARLIRIIRSSRFSTRT